MSVTTFPFVAQLGTSAHSPFPRGERPVCAAESKVDEA